MTDYVIAAGRSPSYPALHFGGQYVGTRATFCELADLKTPSANVLALPNAPVSVLSASAITVGAAFFGAHISTRSNDSLPNTTIKTVRSHDMTGGKSRWAKIQPTDTQVLSSWDFVDLDAWVNTHYAAGRDLVFTLFGTPTWASARPTEQGAYGVTNLGYQAEPADMTDWDFFCTTIATRYLGKIKYYEVWNEPNIGNDGVGDGVDGTGLTAAGKSAKNFFFSGKWPKLAEMTRRANVAIKAVDPTAKIISPPVQGWLATGTDTSGAYFAGMMAASSGDGGSTALKTWIDIVGVHLYTPNTGVDIAAMTDRALAARSAASLTGKEIWDTESSPNAVFANDMNDGQLCRYLTRHMITLASKGFSRHIYYMVDSSLYGFLNRSVVEAYWNTTRTLLMSGTVQSASRIWDGRIVYWVGGTPYIV